MALAPDLLQAIWERAISPEVEIGIAIKTNDPKGMRNSLYVHRKEFGNPKWDEIIIFMPNTNEVWLCKKATKL